MKKELLIKLITYSLLPLILASCGKNTPDSGSSLEADAGIIGGTFQSNSELNFSVALLKYYPDCGPYSGPDGNECVSYCSSLHIGNGFFLTAGHCAEDSFGIEFHNKKRGDIVNGCHIQDRKIHPNYKPNEKNIWSHDIALVYAKCSDQSILEKHKFILPPNKKNNIDFISGFGAQWLGSGKRNSLQSLDIRPAKKLTSIADFEAIEALLANEPGRVKKNSTWVKKMVGNTANNFVSCYTMPKGYESPIQGDSGGPGFYMNEKKLKVATGVFSSYFFTTSEPRQTVAFCYVDVTGHLDWIKKTMATIVKENKQ